jgi:hypothetical protein
MKFQVGDWVIVFGQPNRVAEIKRETATLEDGRQYGFKWLASHQRGYWESPPLNPQRPIRNWSQRAA